jgi:hypothetical protein
VEGLEPVPATADTSESAGVSENIEVVDAGAASGALASPAAASTM